MYTEIENTRLEGGPDTTQLSLSGQIYPEWLRKFFLRACFSRDLLYSNEKHRTSWILIR